MCIHVFIHLFIIIYLSILFILFILFMLLMLSIVGLFYLWMKNIVFNRGLCLLKNTILVAWRKIPLTCSLGCFTKHFIEKIGYKMVLRQPTSRQQVGTLYEMTSPSSLWNASPQTTRVQKHAARHRATTQSFRLSTNAFTVTRARWRNPGSTNASEPRFQPEVWRHNEEQERWDTTGENQWGKWCKMVCKQEKLLLYHSEMLKFVQIYLSIY